MNTYVFIDVSKKQEFIFRNNKLKDNIYNSLVIKAITEIIKINNSDDLKFLPVKLSDFYKDGDGIEKMYSGGGNSILKFKDEEAARKFINCYSKKVLLHYPELELYISYFSYAKEDYQYIRKELHRLADKQKDSRRSRFRRISYGIEKIDEIGRPIIFDNDKTKINNNVDNKDDEKIKAKKYFKEFFKDKLFKKDENLKSKVHITYNLDDYKIDGYIGIISIDGNRMGDMVNEISTFKELKFVADEIEKFYAAAVSNAISIIVGEEDKESKEEKGEGKAEEEKKLKITPIVLAGDDICIITEAQKSIKLAAEILNQIQELSQNKGFKTEYENLSNLMDKINMSYLTACGGVSIVKPAYPFFEAVELAEDMCKNSKIHTHKLKLEDESKKFNTSFIDWRVIKGGKREAKDYNKLVNDNEKTNIFDIKPLYVMEKGEEQSFYQDDVFSYQGFKKIIENLQKQMVREKDPLTSSELQKIKEGMYLGEDRYKMLLQLNKIDLGETFEGIQAPEGIIEKDKENIYILRDIIEALDFFE